MTMEPVITIRSTASNRVLQIGEPSGSFFPVKLTGYSVAANTQLWSEMDAPELAFFLTNLGEHRVPWKGALTWASLEGDLGLSVTCTALGSVTFQVELRGLPGAPEEWSVQVGIETGLGELERLAIEAKGLVDANNAI